MRLLAAAVLLAGCLAGPPSPAPTTHAWVAHQGDVFVPVPLAYAASSVRVVEVPGTGSEPTLGVADDIVLVTGGRGFVYRWSPGGAWSEVGDVRGRDFADQDPFLHYDSLRKRFTVGYLYNFACTNMFASDDNGATWTQNLLGGCLPPGQDHPSWASGPAPAGGPAAPSMMYYAYSEGGPTRTGASVIRSTDGGTTWTDAVRVFDSDPCHGGLVGHPAVGPTGVVYVAGATCNGVRIAASQDAGQTWNVEEITAVGIGAGKGKPPDGVPDLVPPTRVTEALIGNPGLAVDASGTAYVAWPGQTGRLYVASSMDDGQSWGTPWPSSPPDAFATTFGVIVAGDAQRVAVAYLATNTTFAGMPVAQNAPPDVIWRLHVGLVTNITAGEVVTTALPDIVQRGQIWQAQGPAPSRNLRDFIGAVEAGGRMWVAYTDGCAPCSDAASSRSQALRLAVLDTGPGLRGALLDGLV